MKWFGAQNAQERSRSRSEYGNAPKWTLVNDFTIHEDKKLGSGRSFARNSVPKQLHLSVTQLSVINDLEWRGSWHSHGEDRPRGFQRKVRIRFDADMDDRITVFTMDKGPIETFDQLKEATIRPIEEGKVGGDRNAAWTEGIDLTSAELIPAGGLMVGEPSVLNYFESRAASDVDPAEASFLSLSLFIDESEFNRLVDKLSNAAVRPGSIHIGLLCELFEGEVSAAHNDPRWGFGQEYGLLLTKGKHYARVRLDSISIVDREQVLVEPEEEKRPNPIETALAGLDRKLRWTSWLVAASVIVLILLWLRQRQLSKRKRKSKVPTPDQRRMRFVETRNAALKEHADNLGQLLLAWSALEMDITLLLHSLAGIRDRLVDNVLVGMPPIRHKLDAVLAIGYGRRPDDEWYGRLQVLVDEVAGKLHEERNRMVHDFWLHMPGDESEGLARRTHLHPSVTNEGGNVTVKLARSKKITAKGIAGVTARIHTASAEAQELADIFRSKTPGAQDALRAKVEAALSKPTKS